MKKLIAALLTCSLLAGGSYLYYRQEQAKRTSVHGPIVLFGNVDIRDVALSFRVAGRIAAVHFEEGDRVRKGDLVAMMDKQPFTDQVELSTAELETAQVNRRKVEMPFQRRAKLTRIGAISAEERDDAEAARDEAMAQVKTAEAKLRVSMTNLADTEIFAPNDGVILTRVREPGAVVAAGESVCTLALDNPVWVRTYIDEPRLGDIHPGQAATVRTDSGQTYQGQIGFISPQAEFTPKNVETAQLRTDLVYRLRVIVSNPDVGLRQGMPVTVTIAQDPPR
jgi:HlyD family secretion protein